METDDQIANLSLHGLPAEIGEDIAKRLCDIVSGHISSVEGLEGFRTFTGQIRDENSGIRDAVRSLKNALETSVNRPLDYQLSISFDTSQVEFIGGLTVLESMLTELIDDRDAWRKPAARPTLIFVDRLLLELAKEFSASLGRSASFLKHRRWHLDPTFRQMLESVFDYYLPNKLNVRPATRAAFLERAQDLLRRQKGI